MKIMFYVYCYHNPLKIVNGNPEPFYVGKGKNERLLDHLFESSLVRDPNKHKTNTIRTILRAGLTPIITKVSSHENQKDAWDAEMSLIRKLGRRDLGLGPLTNMTDGGEGTTNKIFTEQYRKKLSEATKKAFIDGKLGKNIEVFKNSQKGKKQSKEWIEKRVAAKRGIPLSEKTKQQISESHKLVRQTPEWKLKASAAQLGKKHTPEHTLKVIQNNPRSIPISIEGVTYPSIGSAIRATGLSPGKIRKLLDVCSGESPVK